MANSKFCQRILRLGSFSFSYFYIVFFFFFLWLSLDFFSFTTDFSSAAFVSLVRFSLSVVILFTYKSLNLLLNPVLGFLTFVLHCTCIVCTAVNL